MPTSRTPTMAPVAMASSTGLSRRQMLGVILLLILPSALVVVVHAEPILKIRTTEFTRYNEVIEYQSSKSYNPRGMAPLYEITNHIIDLFVDEYPIPDGYITVQEGNIAAGPNVADNNWGPLLKQYWAILLVAALCIIMIAIMPIMGLCLCCCRCFGGCGGRSQPFDKKHDTCRRAILGFLLICSTSALVFGVVVAFVTNSYMQHGVENITTSARHGVHDTRLYLRSTSSHIDHVLNKNYQELNNDLKQMLNDASGTIIKRLEEQSKAEKLTTLYQFVEDLPGISKNLEKMKQLTSELRITASQLNDGLRGVKRELLTSLNKCGTQDCIKVMEDYKIGRLNVNGIDYNSIQDRYFPRLPDLSEIIESVKELMDSSLGSAIRKGVKQMEQLKSTLNQTVLENIPKVQAASDSTGNAIKDVSNMLTSRLNNVGDTLDNNSYKHLDTADEYIQQYSIYRYYAGLGISSVLLLILICLVFGLLCGICGKRPDGYGDDCCNKGAGGRFLIFAVAIIFLTFSVILAVALASFLAGTLARRAACDSLRDPANDQIVSYIDQFVDLNRLYSDLRAQAERSKPKLPVSDNMEQISIGQVIVACQQNESIYKVLKLNNFVDIDTIRDFPEQYGITRELNALTLKIKINPVQILTPEATEDIKALQASKLNDFDVDKFTDNLTYNITEYNLNEIAQKLRDVADRVPPGKDMNDIKVNLKNQALHLSSYQTNLVDPMIVSTNELIKLSTTLDSSLKFGEKSFSDAIDKFLTQIKEAENYINKHGMTFVQNITEELVTGFTNQIYAYIKFVIDSTENDIGLCGPMYNVYESVIVASCDRIVDPFNGFWAGVVWCLLLFLPSIIFGVKLSTLYQKSDPYPGPMVESEYLYDAYTERDNIPLASGPKNKRRKKQDRRRESRDRREIYYEEGSPSHSRDPRYNDMAPNVESQIPSILTHSGSDTAASSPPPVLLTTSHRQRHTLHQRHHSTPLPMSLPMSLLTSHESQEQDPTASFAMYQSTSPTGERTSSPMAASSFQPSQPPGTGSPNRMLSRLFSKSFFDDFHMALKQYDQYVPAGGSSDLLTVTGHDRRNHHHQPSYLPSMLQQHQHLHQQHHQHMPRTGNVSRSNSSSVGSVRSMALVPTRTPSPLDFRTMSFRRPRSLASEEGGGKQSATRTDSGYEKY
ncbi:prominin-like protein isoform X1 [Anopheles moucheti]|uniref:prominin-like protein isoform X1 n=1 Tax=Anopheles moucheti TaxID=186751 RepID=UPI0022F08804|nr:prominin-like protein isoform X1 [Anopheles moucheti]